MSVEAPTHAWVAKQIGFSVAGVSLIRSGKRTPSIHTMEIIEKAFGWSVPNQVRARHHYAAAFEKKIEVAWKREQRKTKAVEKDDA